jgi:hypothetical protein
MATRYGDTGDMAADHLVTNCGVVIWAASHRVKLQDGMKIASIGYICAF